MVTLLIASMLVLTSSMAIADQVVTAVAFKPPVIEKVGEFHRIGMPGCMTVGEPGSPALPSYGVWLLLSPGERAVSCALENVRWESIPGEFLPEPVSRPRRLSDPEFHSTLPDPGVYQGKSPYPGFQINSLTTHLKRGFALSTCLVFPVRWNPVDGSLQYISSATVVVDTEPGARENTGFERFYKGDRSTREWITDRVLNPGSLGNYPPRDDGETESMLMITVDELAEPAEEYAAWRNARGMQTYLADCDQVIEAEEGVDAQESLRAGIARMYEELGISYVLLLGDTEHIPHRGLTATVNNSPDNDIPADLYYAALDGNWNDNGNNLWGEAVEADLMAEVYIGRIPASVSADAQRTLNKVYLYSDEPVVDDVTRALMVGEELGWEQTGGDHMDEVYEACDLYNFRTSGFPEHFQRQNLYDRDEVWNSVGDLAPLISAGSHLINHLGHASTRYVMKFEWNWVTDNTITNDGVENGFNIALSQGCYCGAFDNRGTQPDNYVGDCIGEKFVSHLENGFVAFIVNSRYGWGDGQSTNGASQHFHREFVDGLFDEGITVIGRTNQDSKEDTVPWVNWGAIRWCYYEINLLGDPAMDIWTDEPVEIEAEFSEAVSVDEELYEVSIPDIPGAIVCLSRDGEIISRAVVDEDGLAVLEIPEPILPYGDVSLSVTAHNFLPLFEIVQSIPANSGFPWVVGLPIADSGGIEDGQADPGETIELRPSVHNLGNVELRSLQIIVETDDPFIHLQDAETEIRLIQPDEIVQPAEPLIFAVAQNCEDLHEVALNLTMEDGEGEIWTQTVNFITHAADIDRLHLTILDENGNNNGRLDPGEEADIMLSANNSGSGRTRDISAVLSSGNPYIEINSSEASLAEVEPFSISEFGDRFSVTLGEDCPDPYRAVFYILLSDERGCSRSYLLDTGIGGAYHTFDRDLEEWEHENVVEDHGDQWHLSDEDNHTFLGATCLKVGSEEEGAPYDTMLNCAAYMPAFNVSGPLNLVFWHKIDAEISEAHVGYAYDGGFLEASVDGGEWTIIYPQIPGGEGYPYLVRHGDSNNPLPEDTPIFSGRHDWKREVFDLSAFEDSEVQVRFRFGTDGAIENTGWWIDDVELLLPIELEPPANLVGEAAGNGLYLSWDTPLPPRDDEVILNELLGYRIFRGSDDWVLLDTLVTLDNYFDNMLDQRNGEYMYMVTAEYILGESQPTNIAFVRWFNAAPGDEQEQPETFEISAIYPNPFNASVRISYSVPAAGAVRLALFDYQGRFLTDIDQGMKLPGMHTVLFDGSRISSGVYLVRLDTPQGLKSSRMILVK